MQLIKSKLYISNIVDTIGNKMQDIYLTIVLQTSWNLFSKLEDEKTVIFWRNSVTDTYWIVKTSKFKKFNISNVNIIEWIFPDNIKK